MRIIKISLMMAALVGICQPAFAISFQDGLTHSNAFMGTVTNFLSALINDGQVSAFVRACWMAFSAFALCFALINWSRNANELDNLLYQTIMVLIVGSIMVNYLFFIDLAWWIHDGVTENIQRVAVGNSDPFFLPGFINDTLDAILQNGISFWDLFRVSFCSTIIMGLVGLLSVLALAVNLWVLWCFAIAQIVGFFIVPLLLTKRFHFIFDGWLRFMMGTIVYGIIARINLILVALLIRTMFQLPSLAVPTQAIVLDGNTIAQLVGLIGFIGISIIALIKTGSFARALVSGATGFGGSISSGARLAVGKII